MMGRCATCKHWRRDAWDENATWRTCHAVPHDDGRAWHWLADEQEVAERREWMSPEDFARAMQIKEARAVVQDGSGYYAALKTHGDFGCVLHTPMGPTT